MYVRKNIFVQICCVTVGYDVDGNELSGEYLQHKS